MDTNTMELNLNEMELVNGGADPIQTAAAAGAGGIVGGASGGVLGICLGLATGPIGWMALGGALLGGAAYATYYTVTSK
jgi:hypothetical protein